MSLRIASTILRIDQHNLHEAMYALGHYLPKNVLSSLRRGNVVTISIVFDAAKGEVGLLLTDDPNEPAQEPAEPKLNREQWRELDAQYKRAVGSDTVPVAPGEHLTLIALLYKLGHYPRSIAHAVTLADDLLSRGYETSPEEDKHA